MILNSEVTKSQYKINNNGEKLVLLRSPTSSFFFFFFNEIECKKGRTRMMQPLWISKDPCITEEKGKLINHFKNNYIKKISIILLNEIFKIKYLLFSILPKIIIWLINFWFLSKSKHITYNSNLYLLYFKINRF